MAKKKSAAGNEQMAGTQVYDVAVVGGGAAGCMAACAASENGARTLILEANDRIGRKNQGESISTTGTAMFIPGQTRRLRSRMLLTKYCARRVLRSSPTAGF